VESLLETAWAFPKFNGVFLASSKEMPKFVKNCSQIDLIWIRFVIKDFPSCVNGVSDNNDFGNVLNAICLVNTAFNGEKLSFSTSDEGSMVNCLDHWLVEGVDMGNGGGNVILDTHISYNDCHIGRERRLQCHIV